MREIPKELQVYKHFKGSLYQIVTVAVHTETKEKLVIYRSISKPDRVFARPVDMFLSEVNHKKYPDVKAKYRFTLLEDLEEEELEEVQEAAIDCEEVKAQEPVVSVAEVNIETTEHADDNRKYKDDGTLVLDPIVERVLDSKEFTDKIEAFELLRGKCTEEMLSIIAMSLDIQLSGETVEEKYADVLKCLRMHQKYETNRLR